MKRTFRAALGDPPRLSALLTARLSVSGEEASTLLRRGAVELDGRRVHEDADVKTGARIIAFLPDAPPADVPAALRVAYRDHHVLVVDKPAGLRSQSVRGDDWDTLIGRVQRELDEHATLLHRLDRETSGLVLLPISDKARAALGTALSAGAIERRYTARVAGKIDAPCSIALRIAIDPADRRRRVALPERDPAGEHALTDLEPVVAGEHESRVILRLHTGRTHQIRVHLAALGHPVLGDLIYGGPPSERLRLHAHELRFLHPTSGQVRTITSDPAIID